MSKPIRINRDFYTMATVDNDTAEITMYGDIVESQPIDWWTGEPIPGQYIIESEFLEDLNAVSGCKSITIRMNSLGGNAGVSILIHNRLRELASCGAALTCIVDGVAMSGGSLIMCACDTVKVNPSSLVMIHKCWTFIWGGYNADELREQATQNDAWDKAQAAIYKRKCGLSDTVIAHMMADTTYMTGKEAIDKGFADELLEDAEPLDIAASADGKSLFVRGREMHLAPGMFVPDTIPTVKSAAPATVKTNTNTPDTSGNNEGGNTMATTIQELREEYPELMAQMESDIRASIGNEADIGAVENAVQAEQNRLKEIDEVAPLFDNELVQSAKYGEKACSAQELAYRAAQQAAQKGHNFMTNLEADANASQSANVGAAPGNPNEPASDEELTPQQRQSKARADVKSLLHGNENEEV